MSVSSRKEIRDHCIRIVDLDVNNSTLQTTVNNFINDTIAEIGEPGWAFRKEIHHVFNFLKRKTTFDTVAATTDYVLPRDVDRIAVLRQETTPARLRQVSDRRFYEADAKRDETGNPLTYRLWEISGVSTKLAVADTIDIVSSSTSDDDDTGLTVTVWGYSGGILRSETYTLDGTTTVAGTISFDADEVFVSKAKDTVGTVTITENSGSTTLVVMAPDERNPLFKVLSLHPIPNSAITMYLQYYTTMRFLEADSDTPQFHQKWHHVVVKGVLAKLYKYLGKETEAQSVISFYRSAVRGMVASDLAVDDYIPTLKRHYPILKVIPVYRTTDDIE